MLFKVNIDEKYVMLFMMNNKDLKRMRDICEYIFLSNCNRYGLSPTEVTKAILKT